MPGFPTNTQQYRLYMKLREAGLTQVSAAVKAGLSERTGRRLEQPSHVPPGGQQAPRSWRTRTDPLAGVWESELVPLLEDNPELLPKTLWEYVCQRYPDQYDSKVERTLQRRIKAWKLQHGKPLEVMFLQHHEPGQQGISDFTQLKPNGITLKGEAFAHRFYHYRLVYSGWCHVKVICGGESYEALATGLQDAWWRSGGTPREHRTDSLSAAYNNLAEEQTLTRRYAALCRHYHVKASRNNKGVAHENGAVEAAHGHFKRRVAQALLLRGSADFDALADYQAFVDQVVLVINKACRTRFEEEKPHLRRLPRQRTNDYAEHPVMVSSSSTIRFKRITYTVPSQWVGTPLLLLAYDERLELYHSTVHLLTLPRLYVPKGGNGRCVNYRHVIDSLVRKPQAFRCSQIRDDLLPNADYKAIWAQVDATLPPAEASRYIVKLLYLAAQSGQELAIGQFVMQHLHNPALPSIAQCRERFAPETPSGVPLIQSHTVPLAAYDALLGVTGVAHG